LESGHLDYPDLERRSVTASSSDLISVDLDIPNLASYVYAYSAKVAGLLERVSAYADQVTLEFVNQFYSDLSNRASTAAILERLRSSEFARLRRKQAEHLRLLISPGLELLRHYRKAQRVGHVHAMVGVGLPELMEAYHHYQVELRRMLGANSAHGLDRHEQEKLLQALQLRLMLDMEAQVTAHAAVDSALAGFLQDFDGRARNAETLPDLLHEAMQRLISVDGIAASLFLRADRQGLLQVEATDGNLGSRYVESIFAHEVPLLDMRIDQPSGKGPAGLAWRTGKIQINDSFESAPALQPWRKSASELGFRSSVAVPLVDESRQTFALLCLYGKWPGFFSTNTRLNFLNQLQQLLGHAIIRLQAGTVLPERTRREYRRRLEKGGVRLFYQPIVDLRSGELHHVEALARMFAVDSSIIPPGEFLRAFGQADFLKLFEMGLAQAAQDLRGWRETTGLDVSVSINLPTDGLSNPDYRDALFDVIEAGGLAASQVRLELLETNDPVDHKTRDALLDEFRRAGVALVQDDLGSGHSSLLRMDQIGFDEVKIDQGLVRSALSEPQRALEFIYHLTRLAYGFGACVTVEGLENEGLIEAATILGADFGQGYAIARPMPAAELLSWAAQQRCSVDTSNPRTALGALAGYLLWDQQLASYEGRPDLIEDLVSNPSPVQRYVVAKGLQDGPVGSLLQSNRACAIQGRRSAMYRHTRTEMIRQLSLRWEAERKMPP
jgi:EAL domain-containing protein (putative c-di-GMP-specific phosphodiesterase class I)